MGSVGSSAGSQAASATIPARASTTAATTQPGAPAQADGASIASEASSLSAAATGATATQGQTAAAAAAASPSSSGVGMQEMINSIHATIEIAARQGATQARIALQPEELGQLSIHLSQTSEGLLARVSAETPAAAQALADGRSELRRSLSSLGLPLLRLDISSYGQSEARERQDRFAAGGNSPGPSTRSTSSTEDGDAAEPVGALAGAAAPAAIAGGELVDGLA
jgi:flagellar hook-length control protein FliK